MKSKAAGHADALDFSRRRPRQRIDEHDAIGHLEGDEPRGNELAKLAFAADGPGPQHDRRRDGFAEPRIGHRKSADLGDRLVCGERLIDFRRTDLLAAAIDDLFQPACDEQIAVIVEPALVAGPEPAVDERLRVRLGRGLVARGDRRSLEDDLAGLASREQLAALGIPNRDTSAARDAD